MGVCAEVEAAQTNINEHIKHVQRCQRLGSNAYLLVHGKSGVRPEAITNSPLTIIRHDGPTPEWRTVSATPPDLQAEVDRIVQQTMQSLGLSPGTMQGLQRPGVTSGRAIQMESQLQSRRHADNAARFENFAIDVAGLIGRINDSIVEDHGDYTVKAQTRRNFIQNTKWADVMIPESDVHVTCQSIDNFITTPAGQTDTTDRFVQMGGLTLPQSMEALEFPDVGRQVHEANLDKEYAQYQLEDLLDGKPIEPNAFQNLDVAIEEARKVRLAAEMDGAPFEVLDAVEEYIEAAKGLIPPPPEPAIPMGPEAAPMMGA